MKYTVYKTINLVNNKIYIGKHQTEDPNDDYLGSGKLLRRAIEKYGIENFKKEVLFIFETEEEMNSKEAELVTEQLCKRKDNYNLCNGGKGGFAYINRTGKNLYGHNGEAGHGLENLLVAKEKHLRKLESNIVYRKKFSKKISEAKIKFYKEGGVNGFAGKQHSLCTKMHLSEVKRGKCTGKMNSNAKPVFADGETYDTMKEAAEKLGVHENTVRERIRRGKYRLLF